MVEAADELRLVEEVARRMAERLEPSLGVFVVHFEPIGNQTLPAAREAGVDRPPSRDAITIAEAVMAVVSKLDREGELDRLSSVEDLEDALRTVLPRKRPWSRILGPVLTGAGLARRLGISEQAVSKQADRFKLLRVPTAERRSVYPTWQFTPETVQALPGLQETLFELHKGLDDPISWAIWLREPNAELDDTPPLELLRAGGQDRAVRAARNDAAAFAA